MSFPITGAFILSLLLPEQYPIVPLEDATPLLNSPDRLLEMADEQGFLYFRELMPLELVEEVRAYTREVAAEFGWVETDENNPPYLRAKSEGYFEGHGWDDPRFVEMQVKVCYSAPFRRLVTDDRVMNILEVMYGEAPALATANHVWLKLPGSPEHTTLPHQDIYYLPDSPRLWTVWYPLVDTPLDVGPLGVVPGSHKKTWPHVDRMTGVKVGRDVTFATCDYRCGDLVAFNAKTIHCAWSNVSPEYARLSLDVRYEPKNTEESVLRPR